MKVIELDYSGCKAAQWLQMFRNVGHIYTNCEIKMD